MARRHALSQGILQRDRRKCCDVVPPSVRQQLVGRVALHVGPYRLHRRHTLLCAGRHHAWVADGDVAAGGDSHTAVHQRMSAPEEVPCRPLRRRAVDPFGHRHQCGALGAGQDDHHVPLPLVVIPLHPRRLPDRHLGRLEGSGPAALAAARRPPVSSRADIAHPAAVVVRLPPCRPVPAAAPAHGPPCAPARTYPCNHHPAPSSSRPLLPAQQ
mmetsp:Transcript_7392/g.18065  ORF Transcript_7392/g.18065 Transcript_7392/m.18065 type:complete len:213 (-) Transcript_7392:183-821(-)